MVKLFKFKAQGTLHPESIANIRRQWEAGIQGTDLEGSRLLVVQDDADIEPLSGNAVLQEAARVLEQRGRHVYAAELRRLARGE